MLSIVKSEKICGNPKCKIKGPQLLSAFNKNRAMRDGLGNYCRICQSEANANWTKNNRDKVAKKAKRLREKWKRENPKRVWAQRRNHVLKKEYGITLNDYYKMLHNQNNKCGICGRNADEFPKKLVVDHCHVSGKVRKLLCGLCNQMLGSAKENIKTLRKAIDYLEEFSGG